jgi:hypothetical protein
LDIDRPASPNPVSPIENLRRGSPLKHRAAEHKAKADDHQAAGIVTLGL